MSHHTVVQVAANDDDARVQVSSGVRTLSLTVGNLIGSGSATVLGWEFGARFLGVNIPKHAVILTAVMSLLPRSDKTVDVCNSSICAELSGTPAIFTTLADYDARARSASVTYNNVPHALYGQTYATPDFSSVVQEIANSYVITDLVIFWGDPSQTSDVGANRQYESYNTMPASAPSIDITWDDPPMVLHNNNNAKIMRGLLL
jgi:hypothetical protein